MQFLKMTGCRAIATAGSPPKRVLLRSLLDVHVLDSRGLAFSDEAVQLGGTDVLLNTLTSPGTAHCVFNAHRKCALL